MNKLFDPLTALSALGAYVHADTLLDGQRTIRLTWRHDVRRAAQRKGEVLRARFERLLLLQLDVPSGHRPRTVQQLVAARHVQIVDGRYILKG